MSLPLIRFPTRPHRLVVEGLDDYLELSGGGPAHFDAVTRSFSTIDRVHVALPRSLLLVRQVRLSVPKGPEQLLNCGASDRSPI